MESEVGPVLISVENRETGLVKVLIRTTDSYEIYACPPKIRHVRSCLLPPLCVCVCVCSVLMLVVGMDMGRRKASDLTKALRSSHPQLSTAVFREVREKTGDSEFCQVRSSAVFFGCFALISYRRRWCWFGTRAGAVGVRAEEHLPERQVRRALSSCRTGQRR
jgi:hypothetical protein